MTHPITFLSDYGPDDGFAGVCRAVIARIAPQARVIDLSHGIARHDVRRGAIVLANALPYAPAGVHLAVVDPGVGSDRRAIAVRSADRLLVGPDNGLLSLALARLGGATEAVEVSASPVRLEPVSATFHGRDVFAPVAAHLALGAEPAELGEWIAVDSLVGIVLPESAIEPGCLRATVGDLDGFGNAALLATAEEGAAAGLAPGRALSVETPATTVDAVFALTFADVAAGGLIVYADSDGCLALAVNRGSAVERLGLSAGDRVALRPA
jgi:S-adenosylmethionine hydrolase